MTGRPAADASWCLLQNHVMGQFSLIQTLVTGGTTYFIRKR